MEKLAQGFEPTDSTEESNPTSAIFMGWNNSRGSSLTVNQSGSKQADRSGASQHSAQLTTQAAQLSAALSASMHTAAYPASHAATGALTTTASSSASVSAMMQAGRPVQSANVPGEAC